ncbi:hypothetical protein MMC13_007761 [Lambiella insularis]|nr:hypothetical protein [Lambiella insularis]
MLTVALPSTLPIKKKSVTSISFMAAAAIATISILRSPLFGIGRTSTQSSLASLETVADFQSSRRRSFGALNSVSACSNHVDDLSSQRPGVFSLAQSTITHHSLAPEVGADSSGQKRSSAIHIRQAESSFFAGKSLVRKRPTSDQVSFTPSKTTHPRQGTIYPALSIPRGTSSTARKVFDQLKTKLLRRRTRDFGTMTEEEEAPFAQEAQAGSSIAHNRVPFSENDGFHQDDAKMTEHRAHPDELTDDEWDPLGAKQDRLRVQRRQATLKDQRGQQRICLCREGCHCMGSRGTTTPRSIGSRTLSNIPRHQLDHLLHQRVESSTDSSEAPARPHSPTRHHVAFTGAHVQDERTGQNPPGIRLMPEEFQFSRQSTSTNTTITSQATTAINSSSSGGRSSRQQSQRVNSLPMQPFIELLNRYIEQARPEVITALHDFSAVHHPQPHSSPENELDQQTPSRTVPPGADSQGPLLPRASSTSLSHLPDPSSGQESGSDGAETCHDN